MTIFALSSGPGISGIAVTFMEKHKTYSNKMLEEANISTQELSDYADYRLGKQIKDCIEKIGSCSFTAEL